MRRLPVIAVGLMFAGCGGSDGGSTSPTTTTPAKAKPAPPPAELVGTYTTTLRPSDLPSPVPPELEGSRRWIVKITKSGGIDDAPTLTITQPGKDDALESSTLSVSGSTLKLSGQECAQPTGGDKLVSSAYRYTLDGDTLRLTTVKPGCPDKVAETILASRPLTRD